MRKLFLLLVVASLLGFSGLAGCAEEEVGEAGYAYGSGYDCSDFCMKMSECFGDLFDSDWGSVEGCADDCESDGGSLNPPSECEFDCDRLADCEEWVDCCFGCSGF